MTTEPDTNATQASVEANKEVTQDKPARAIVIPPKPPVARDPQPEVDMPPLKWRKKYLKNLKNKKKRRQRSKK